jgi:predicted acetyltransferase
MSEVFSVVVPGLLHLPAYRAALEGGWSPDNVNGAATARRELDSIADNPVAFLASLDDREALGEPIVMPDGTTRTRLPSYRRWLWDGDFCGSIGFRWQKGTASLPSHVLGHIGFGVIPRKRGHGYAAKAVLALLPDARALGLAHVDLTTSPDNIASQRSIERAGGKLIGSFTKDAAYGGDEGLLYRISL